MYLFIKINKKCCATLLLYLKVALASCSSFTARRFFRSVTSASSIAFWSWLWMMKSSRRLAMSSSRSVTCSIPRRSSASSWACWCADYKLTCNEIVRLNFRQYFWWTFWWLKQHFLYPVYKMYLPILALHLTWLPVLVDLDPGNWLIKAFDAHILK